MSLTQQMSPDGGGRARRHRLTLVLAALGAVVVLVVVTVVLTLAVADDPQNTAEKPPPGTPAPTRFGIPPPQPGPTTAPAQDDVLVLPAPARTAPNGVPLGFPHTTAGAVSAAVRWHPLLVPGQEARQLDVLQTVATPSFYATYGAKLREGYRRSTDPPGRWYTFFPLACRVLSESEDEVQVGVYYSAQAGQGNDITEPSFLPFVYRMAWAENDWRVGEFLEVPEELTKPGTNDPRALRDAGWKEYRLA